MGQEATLTGRPFLGTAWRQPSCRRSWKEPSGSWDSFELRRLAYSGSSGRLTPTGR